MKSEGMTAVLKRNHSSFGAKHALLAIAIAMNCRTFQFFPGMPLVQELWYGYCLFLLIVVFPFWKSKTRWRFSRLELYLLIVMLILPVTSALCAWSAFGQPVSYGLAAERSITLFVFIIAISYALRRRLLKVEDVEKSLLFLAWGTLLVYTAMRVWLQPVDFTSYGIGFVSGLDELAEFKFQPFFTVFGFFYYVFRGFRAGSTKNYAIALLFLASTIGAVGGRGLTISIALGAFILFFRWGGTGFLLKTLPKMLLFIAALLGILYVRDSEAVSARYGKFSDAFQVLTGVEVDDPSAASRALQVLNAVPHIAEHPVFGNGLASNLWQRNQEHSISDFFPADYFYPADIGAIGVLYLYGVFGILLFAWQYRFALAAVASLPGSYHTPLLDATKGFLIFSVFSSVTSGIFVFDAEVVLLFIVLLGSIASDSVRCAETSAVVSRGSQRPLLST
jgi:uncharacterized membrane protein